MNDVRELVQTAATHPPAADPVGRVHRRVARRRARRRTFVASGAAAVTTLGVVTWATTRDRGTERVTPVANGTLPSGGSERATPPSGSIDQPTDLASLGTFVSAHPEAFVGLYLDGSGVAVVAFGSGVDPAAWESGLRAAAGEQAWRTIRCGATRAALDDVQRALGSFAWPSGRPSYAADVDPATCSVRVVSDMLSPADLAALHDRFGAAVTVDPTGHPTRR